MIKLTKRFLIGAAFLAIVACAACTNGNNNVATPTKGAEDAVPTSIATVTKAPVTDPQPGNETVETPVVTRTLATPTPTRDPMVTATPIPTPEIIVEATATPVPTQDPANMNENNSGGELKYTPTPVPTKKDPTPTPQQGTENLIDPGKDPTGSGVSHEHVIGDQSGQGTVSGGGISYFDVKIDGVTVELAPYAGLTLHMASSDDVDAAVAKKLATVKEEVYVNDPAKNGDFVNYSYYCNVLDDGYEFERAYTEDGITSRLGSNEMVLGFEPAILGKRTGDTASFTYTYEPSYHDDRFAGKTVKFYITINSIYRIVTPSLNAESVSMYFGYDSVSDFVYAVKQETNRKAYENEIYDYLFNNCDAKNIKSSEINAYADFLYQKYVNYANANSWQYDFNADKCIEEAFGFASMDACKAQCNLTAKSRYKAYYIIKGIAHDMKAELTTDEYSFRFNQYMNSIDFDSPLEYEYNEFETDYAIYTNVVMDFIISKAKFAK